MKQKVSDYIWDYVAQLGVKHVFMFPGGGAMHLVDSLGRSEDLEYVTLMHEQACAMAAETYSRISHNLGVVLVTTGPGGTNAVTGVAAAWLESTPMLVISGQVKTVDLKGDSGVRQKGNQEIGIVDIVSSITKYAVTIGCADDIRYHLDKALYEALNGRPGPVWLDIPLDIQASMVETEELRKFDIPKGVEDGNECLHGQTEEVVALLRHARHPVLIAGQGIERKNGTECFRKLVDILKIPVLTSWIGVELLEYSHPFHMGKPGMVAPRYSNFTMQNADLIIAIGTRLDASMIGYDPQDFAPKAKKVIVDIDQAELDKFEFPIAVKIKSDATTFINTILELVKKDNLKLDTEDWLLQCREWKDKYPVVLDKFRTEGDSIHPYYFVEILSEELSEEDVIIPGSSGAGIDAFWMCLQNKRNQRTLATGSLGSMGYGIPASIGACLASGKRTICVEGDGSLQLNIQELASIRGMKLPLKIFVLNNGGYLSIMNMQRTHFSSKFVGAEKGSHLYIPDIIAVAKAYGLLIFELRAGDDISRGIKEVLESEGPALCNVLMSNELVIQPKVMSRVDENGSMVSGKLEDLWPFLEDEN